MQIPQETIDAVRDRADIVEVISRFVDLKRAGSNYKALCPFHEEKTPSFNVNPDRQIFHCFGCGVGGNVFTFLMEMEGVSFPEAVRSLGKTYGVEVETRRVPQEDRSRNERLFEANEFACRFFEHQLASRRGEPVRRYLEKRGISESTWKAFRVGYTGPDAEGLWKAARKRKVPPEVLRELKLVLPSERSDGCFDYFRQRLVFPIAALSGRVIAFGARTMVKGGTPKYLNSVESEIYVKRRTLYGLHMAREAIRKRRSVVLVEGYTDCISMYVNGFENTVASCGTAITAEHANLLRRLTRQVVLMPDGDAAGADSAIASGAFFLAAGLDVSVVRLEDGQDPDTVARELGPEKTAKILGGALAYLDYLDYIMRDRQLTPRDKESLIQRVTGPLGALGDPLRYEVIVQDLARILEVSPESLRRRKATEQKPEGPASATVGKSPQRAQLEKSLLRLLLESTPAVAEARDKLDADDFSQPKCRQFYKLLDSAWESHIDIRSSTFQKRAEAAELEGFAAEIALISIPPGNLDILLSDKVRRIKRNKIRDELDVLHERLQVLPMDSEEATSVAKQYELLRQALEEL